MPRHPLESELVSAKRNARGQTRTVGGVEASDAARCCQDLDFVNPKPSVPNAGNEAGT